ncbi:MAG: N-acetylneuraminate synthase family protein [Fulvivirga sp.]
MERPVHIIAEAGTNHNGNFETAKELVEVAADAGADSVKFQIIYPDNLYLPGNYKYGHYDIKKVIQMRRDFMLEDGDYAKLQEHALNRNIILSASVFCDQSTDLLASLNPPYIKIASTDLNNLRLIRYAATKGIKLIISTGMSTLSQVERTVNELSKINFKDFILMHCVSAYPTKLADMNLNFIDTLKTAFGCDIGLSDHTQNSIAACLALTKGIKYIEKHYTLDPKQEGFDHAYAADPDIFKRYVNDIREAESALIFPDRKLKDDELYVKQRARRSLYARKYLKKGHILRDEDILIVRPEGPLNSEDYDLIIGKKLVRDIDKNAPFTLDIMEN